MISSVAGSSREVQRGRDPQCGSDSSLLLYQTAILIFAVALTIGLAGNGDIHFDHWAPVLLAAFGLWGLFDVIGYFIYSGTERGKSIKVIGDLTFCLCLVGWTGGVESFLLPILLASIALAGSQLDMKRAVFLATGTAVILLLMPSVLSWVLQASLGIQPLVVPGDWGWNFATRLIAQLIAIFAVAVLGSRLGGGLQQAERINDLIVEAMEEGVLIVDQKKRIRHVNPIAQQILGYPEDSQIRGKLVSEVLKRTDDDQLRREFENPCEGSRVIEYRYMRSKTIPLRLKVSFAHSARSGEGTCIFLMRDLALEKRVSKAEARLEHLEELEDLALGLAHEIRNPLASIRGGVQELSRGKLNSEQSHRIERVILRESDRLDRTVNQFMEYSRTRAGQDCVCLSLLECTSEAIELLAQRQDAREVEFTVNCADCYDPFIEGDPDLIHKLILNLGINALEAFKHAGRIDVELKPGRDNGPEITVRDNGPGMEEKVKARAFNPFFTTKTREGGLGLAIVRKIVDAHRGEIEIESELGLGTAVRVWFPEMNNQLDFSNSDSVGV